MRLLLNSLLLLFFIVLVFPVIASVNAAVLKFDKTTVTTTANQTFDVQVVIDAGSAQILGVDSYIVYDPALLEPQNVVNGTYFPTVLNNTFSGKVYIAGIVNDPATFKTGSGTLATVTFKALKDGAGKLTFYCTEGANDSSKILKNDTNATNVIQCANNGQVDYTIGSGGGTTQPSVTPAPTISKLPQTGFMDSFNTVGMTGAVLLLIGIGAKIFIL